jgi:hypothetical protein
MNSFKVDGDCKLRIVHIDGGINEYNSSNTDLGVPKAFRMQVKASQITTVYVVFDDGSSKAFSGTTIDIIREFTTNSSKTTDIYFKEPSFITFIDFAMPNSSNYVMGNDVQEVSFKNGHLLTGVSQLRFDYLKESGFLSTGVTKFKNLIAHSKNIYFYGFRLIGKGSFSEFLSQFTAPEIVDLAFNNSRVFIGRGSSFEVKETEITLPNSVIDFTYRGGIEPANGYNTLIVDTLNSKLQGLNAGGSRISSIPNRLPDTLKHFAFYHGGCNLDFTVKPLRDMLPSNLANLSSLAIQGGASAVGALDLTGVGTLGYFRLENFGLTGLTFSATTVLSEAFLQNNDLTTFDGSKMSVSFVALNLNNNTNLMEAILGLNVYNCYGGVHLNNCGLSKQNIIDTIVSIYNSYANDRSSARKTTLDVRGLSNASLVQPTDGVYPVDDADANTKFGFVRGGGTTSDGTAGSGDGVTLPSDGTPANVFEYMYVLVNQCKTDGFHRYGLTILYNS